MGRDDEGKQRPPTSEASWLGIIYRHVPAPNARLLVAGTSPCLSLQAAWHHPRPIQNIMTVIVYRRFRHRDSKELSL